MKKLLSVTIAISLLSVGCTENSNKTPVDQGLKTSAKEQLIKVSGKVIDINFGTDGYTAKVLTSSGDVYFATLSIPNMGPEQFKQFAIGDLVTIEGQLWLLGQDKQVLVRKASG